MTLIDQLAAERQRIGLLDLNAGNEYISDCVLQACMDADHYLVEYQDGPVPYDQQDTIRELINELSFYK